jgi:hypothetical protein
MTLLAEGVATLWHQFRPGTIRWPASFTLDGDVLRSSHVVLARWERDTHQWRFGATPLAELKALMHTRSEFALRGLDAYTQPQATGQVARPKGRYDLDVVIQAWPEAAATSAIASKRPASTRIFQLDGVGSWKECVTPQFERQGAHPSRMRMTVVSGSCRDEAQELAPYGIAPAKLAEALRGIADHISPDRRLAPAHVSVVSCALEDHLYAGYGKPLARAMLRTFPGASPTISLRTVPYAVDDEGRKLQRTRDGDFMHRRPGGTVVLSWKPDGSLQRREKDVERGQSFILPRSGTVDPLLNWLAEFRPASTRPKKAAKASVETDDWGEPYLMGEVVVQRSTLSRMGASQDGRTPFGATPSELRAPDAMFMLRFRAAPLVAFLAGPGHVSQRIEALQLLKQMMRNGIPPRNLLRDDGPYYPRGPRPQAEALLDAIDQGMDDALHLSPEVWAALWSPNAAPALPLRSSEVSANDLPPPAPSTPSA